MLIQKRQEFEAALSVMLDAEIIFCDTETFLIEPDKPTYQMGIVFRTEIEGRDGLVGSFYMPFRHQHNPTLFKDENLPMEWLGELKLVFDRSDLIWVFHNAKFDLAVLKRDNLVPTGKIYDSMLMSHMSDENKRSHALKQLPKQLFHDNEAGVEEDQVKKVAKSLGGTRRWQDGWHLVPPQVMGIYAEKDVALTERVWRYLVKDLEQQELLHLWNREEEFCLFLGEVEEHGVLINGERAKQLSHECSTRRAEILDELGFDPGKLDLLARKLFSPEPLGLGFPHGALGEPSQMFPLGRPSTAKAVLLNIDHPIADTVLEYRGLVKAQGTWLEGFLSKMWTDGRVRASYRQHGTVTTRLSCSDPNMQQLPRTSEEEKDDLAMKERVKSIIDAPEGWEVWSLDYSQMEFRLAGCYSKAQRIIEAYMRNADMHTSTAEALGISRYAAKTVNFLIIYGGGAKKLAEQLGVPEEEARKFLTGFWESYPELAETVAMAERTAAQQGFVKLWTGRRRHFRYPSEYHKAFNSVVQGGAAEIVKESCIKLRSLQKAKPVFHPIAQVHDDVWFEVRKDSLDVLDDIQEVMEWPNNYFDIPFPVDRKKLAG